MSDPMQVAEVFHSVQGEGHGLGRPMIFVRFAGCNLNCAWCDSRYALKNEDKDGKAGQKFWYGRDVDPFVAELRELMRINRCKSVCLTGGEPTIQPTALMSYLLKDLSKLGAWISMETNGVKRPSWVAEYVDWTTVSPKAPADPDAFYRDYGYADEIKYVLMHGEEIPHFMEGLPEHRYVMPMTKQPFAEHLEYNMRSYQWAAEQVAKSGEGWHLTARIQELADIR
jgi:organic radical activating enzyme